MHLEDCWREVCLTWRWLAVGWGVAAPWLLDGGVAAPVDDWLIVGVATGAETDPFARQYTI